MSDETTTTTTEIDATNGAPSDGGSKRDRALADLLDESRWARIRTVKELAASEPVLYAMRRVLFTDRDAEVRAGAAGRLGELVARDGVGSAAVVESWLLDAIGDPSPLVRDAILRSLARVGGTASLPALRELAERDGMWWVRRGALYALGAIGATVGAPELAALTKALADPFWRVRHAAVRVLSVLGARDPDVRDEVAASESSAAITFLRGTWGPVALEAPTRAQSPSRLPAYLLDPDPAVVTARLAEGSYDPMALVELLCDPHVPLRSLAVQRILESGNLDALETSLDWLEEVRIPHVVDTVHRMLDGLGDPALELATRALARTDRPGAMAWAIGWVVATRAETLYDVVRRRVRAADARVRILALRLFDDAELLAWANTATDAYAERLLVEAIASELHERRTPAARDALLQLANASPRIRTLQLDIRARRDEADAVSAALADSHHGPRAIAARYVARARRDAEGATVGDADPAVREAAVIAEHAHTLVDDIDPWVRRAAIDALARAWRGRHVAYTSTTSTTAKTAKTATTATAELPPHVRDAAVRALRDHDPWIRARALALPITDDAMLARAVGALGDPAEMVRAAASDAVESLVGADDRIRALLATELAPATRALAYGWLLRSLDDAARDFATARFADETAPQVRGVLAAVAGIELPRETRIEGADPVRPVRATPALRPFGRVGFDVAPLAISGAYDLSQRALLRADEAGVNLYFWEPGYDMLTRHLRVRERRDRVHVITGSYHAEPHNIEADIDRALRKLRRDSIDAFLLFWTRSSARLDEAAFAHLERMKRAGKVRAIGFSTHHRTIAREAIEARAWDVVMTRHSAAHPGIESELLPTARERGTAIVTFSALTYGRMLSGADAPTAAECYRYTLSQPGVTACISAPRRYREVVENLEVVADPVLAPERIAALREHGRAVHVESQRFNTLVRQPTRDAAAAARELLASEPPPSDAAADQRMPQASTQRRSKTRLSSQPRRRSR